MIMNQTAMALGESAIEILYRGKKNFATIVIDADGGGNYRPLVSLGVSDTDLATAVQNKVAAFTAGASSTLDDLVNTINNFGGGTINADNEIVAGDFQCRVKDALASDSIHDAAAAEFTDEAGTTTNLRGAGWTGTLVRDNDVNGTGAIYKRVPPPSMSQGPVCIASITGVSTQSNGTAITNGLKRTIYDTMGNVLWTITDTTPTSAEMQYVPAEPVVFNTPVVIKDEVATGTDYAEMDATSTIILWGFPGNND